MKTMKIKHNSPISLTIPNLKKPVYLAQLASQTGESHRAQIASETGETNATCHSQPELANVFCDLHGFYVKNDTMQKIV